MMKKMAKNKVIDNEVLYGFIKKEKPDIKKFKRGDYLLYNNSIVKVKNFFKFDYLDREFDIMEHINNIFTLKVHIIDNFNLNKTQYNIVPINKYSLHNNSWEYAINNYLIDSNDFGVTIHLLNGEYVSHSTTYDQPDYHEFILFDEFKAEIIQPKDNDKLYKTIDVITIIFDLINDKESLEKIKTINDIRTFITNKIR